jgi:4-carboxymuconolactone decarboxylase
MSRIVDIPVEGRTEEQARLYDKVTGSRGMFYSPYKVWIYSPTVGFGMEIIGAHLNSTSSSLSAAEMELAVLVTARYWNADYVIKNHARHGLKAGLDEATVEGLKAGLPQRLEDGRLQAVYDFTSSALRGETPSEIDFERYDLILTRAGIADILALIGYFTSVSLAMKTHGV